MYSLIKLIKWPPLWIFMELAELPFGRVDICISQEG